MSLSHPGQRGGAGTIERRATQSYVIILPSSLIPLSLPLLLSERCFHFSLVCRPQVPAVYKRSDDGEVDGGADELKEARGSGHSTDDCGRIGRKRGGDQRKRRDVEVALATAVRAETDRSVLLELIFDRLDPKPFAAIYLETVIESSNRCLASTKGVEGVDKGWTVCVLRKWWVHSNLVGADTSWGMGKAVARLLNVSAFDMEDSEATKLDFPAQTITTRLQALEKEMVAGAAELQKHPVYLDLLSQFSPTVAIYAVGTTADGLSVGTNNEAFSMLFRGADRRYYSMVLYKTLPFILFLALVAPDDRREWTRFIIEASTRAPAQSEGQWRQTRIFKLVNAESIIQLYLVEARSLPGLGMGGLALILEPWPPSRHLIKQFSLTPRADRRDGEADAVDATAITASSFETAVAGHEQGRRVDRRDDGVDGKRLIQIEAGAGEVKVMMNGCSSIVFPGIAALPFSGSPASSPIHF